VSFWISFFKKATAWLLGRSLPSPVSAEIPLERFGQIVFPELDMNQDRAKALGRRAECRRDTIVVVEPPAHVRKALAEPNAI
jgi:hypothetical protein